MIRSKRGHCINCGYDLRGADPEACLECGAVVSTVGCKLIPVCQLFGLTRMTTIQRMIQVISVIVETLTYSCWLRTPADPKARRNDRSIVLLLTYGVVLGADRALGSPRARWLAVGSLPRTGEFC